MYSLLEKYYNPEAQKADFDDILSSARHIAKDLSMTREHAKEVENFALEIF
jgi:hypothetical protein